MSQWETTIIPLKDASDLLIAFGVDTGSDQVHRWKREDGFRWIDLEGLLSESDSVLVIDWREELSIALEEIQEQLEQLQIDFEFDLDENEEQGDITVDGATKAVKYIPDDGDEFHTVIDTINELIQPRARYRMFRSSEGSDTWSYALLTEEAWRKLESDAPKTVVLLFA